MPIVLNNINKKYGEGDGEVNALVDISLKIDDGEMVAVMGPSGSGKSTLLNILGCIDNATSGEYYFNGEDLSKLNSLELAQYRNSQIGFVFQYFALLNDYTIYENIEMPLLKRKQPKKERRKLVEDYLKQFGIIEQKNKRPSEISGGQQQRAAIIRALVTNPSCILADEPTGALDKKTSENIMSILKDINKQGKTIVIVTHDINVARCCDRIINIEDGRILRRNG